MSNVVAIAKREMTGYFASPIAFVFIVIFLLLSGFLTFMVAGFFENGQATLTSFWLPWLYLFLVPAIGMRMWSEERRLGTIELLLTMPITAWQAIMGKFVAAWAVIALAVVLTFPFALTVNYLGDPDNGIILTSYLGSLLLAGAYLAISAMTSALTRNQVISFILSVVFLLFLILAGWEPVLNLLGQWAPVWLVNTISAFSLMTHFVSIQNGVIDSRDILFFLSVIVFALFTTSVILRSHRAG
jgi:ABC-2 type transport system permease protein